jgi:hypothetical protein
MSAWRLRRLWFRTIVMETSSAWWTHQAWGNICAAVHSQEAKKKDTMHYIWWSNNRAHLHIVQETFHYRIGLTSHTRQCTRAQTP